MKAGLHISERIKQCPWGNIQQKDKIEMAVESASFIQGEKDFN